MPNGFIGTPCENYLRAVADAMSASARIHSQNPFANVSNRAVTPPPLPPRINQRPAFSVAEARTGSHTTGVGNSSNIVVGQQPYQNVMQRINQTDDNIGRQLYEIATEMENLCSTSYVVPKTVVRCLDVLGDVKRSMGEFRSLTEDANMETRSFTGDILSIG